MTSVPVTALVPTYNRAGLLPQAIDSVLSQSAPPREVIVVDDGSTDDTADVLALYGRDVRVIRKTNGGKSSALNAGIAAATQPRLWIFDDDDVAAPDGLEALHDVLDRTPDAGFSYGLLDKFRGFWPAPTSAPNISYAAASRRALRLKLMEDFFLWQGAMLLRTEAVRAVGGFDERFARSQDYEFVLRLASRYAGVGVPRVIFHQRHHLGPRGPRHDRVKAAEVEARWAGYVRMMFSELRTREPLSAFLVEGAPTTPRRMMTALLQRAAIMGRKGLWREACEDLADAARIATAETVEALERQERSALRAVFERGARSHLEPSDVPLLRAALAAFPLPIADEVRGNLLFPVTRRIRLLRKDGPGAGTVVTRILSALVTPGALAALAKARRTDDRHFAVEVLAPEERRPAARDWREGAKAEPEKPGAGMRMVQRPLAAVAPDALLALARARRRRRWQAEDAEPTEALVRRQFETAVGRSLDLRNPRGLSAELNARKLRPAPPLMTECADKIAARGYVARTVGERYLTRLIMTTERLADVGPARIPDERFVVKSNHDFGGVFICRDRKAFDWVGVRAALADRLSQNHWRRHRESQYRDIPPAVLVEEFLEADTPEGLTEYKVFCFHGRPDFVMVVRETAEGRTKTMFDPSWRRLPWRRSRAPVYPGSIERPKRLGELLEVAGTLSAPFDFARIDLYETFGRVVFGEVTFTPEGGLAVFEPERVELALGALLRERQGASARTAA